MKIIDKYLQTAEITLTQKIISPDSSPFTGSQNVILGWTDPTD
ncbi:MAG: hypothetical protein ACK5GH_02335 [Akkermansiaceae bacterium]|jgi:hypothetical protein